MLAGLGHFLIIRCRVNPANGNPAILMKFAEFMLFRYLYMIMTNEKLNEYKKKLEQERLLLGAEVKRVEKPVDLGIDIARSSEESDMSEEVGNQLAVAGDLKNRMDDIENALGKIATGKYGICEKCGEPIEEEILDIDPESRFCKKDKAGK